MSMSFIRKLYNVPAKRGMLVCFRAELYWITSASNYLRLRPYYYTNRKKGRLIYVHPTDDVAYFSERQNNWIYTDCSQQTITTCKIYSASMEF